MSLQKITKHIVLDVSASRHVSVLVKQYDINIREIIVKITDNGKPYPIDDTIKPRIKCKKEDGTFVFNDCKLLQDNTIEIEITDQMTACKGHHECELLLSNGNEGQVLHTMNFVIIVKESVFPDEEITSSNEFLSLEEALIKLDTTINIGRITEGEIDALFG